MTSENKTDEADLLRAGWVGQNHLDTFSAHVGPFFWREKGPVPGVGFFAKNFHLNVAGVVHGGALLTLADMSLFDICFRSAGVFKGLTVTLNGEFVGAGYKDQFIEATGDIIKSEGSLLFARGLISTDGKTLMSFSGTIKRLKK